MKTLVVLYSRHGHTRMVGKKISKILRADYEDVIDMRSRKDIISWAESAYDSDLRTPTKIKKPVKKPENYDLVVIGTPIWDGIVPAIKTYLKQEKFFGKVAFFSTYGASAENAFDVMASLSRSKPIATMGLQDREIILREDKKKIKMFCDKIKKRMK